MKKVISTSLTAALLLALLVFGCQNLDVQNQNEPDEARALATPSDVESLIKGSFLSFFQATQDDEPGMGYAVSSDTYTCSWGNFGMSFLSQEPRVEYDNRTGGGDTEDHANEPWFRCYGAISAANDGIRNISSGAVTLGAANARALAFAKLVQGLAHGYVAVNFDQGFIFDENVNLETETLELQPWQDVLTAAVAMLEDAAAQSNAATFTLPADWINGKAYTNTELAQLAHSFIARYLAESARTPAERQALNWNTIMSHVSQGLTETWGVVGLGAGRSDTWYSAVHWYSAEHATWQRLDYKLIGPSDASNAYADWLAKAPADRNEFIFPSTDLRIWDGTLDASGTQNPGLYMKQIGPTSFPGSGYQFSRYGQYQFDEYRFIAQTASLAPMYRTEESDFLRAEGLLHTGGSPAEIAALLDKTHVTKGGYPSTAGLPVGSISDKPNPQHDKGATLWSVLKYEKNMELLGTFGGLQFFDNRGWGELTSRTMLHMPVPAQDLETLGLTIYSHGGTTGDTAPKRGRDIPKLMPPQY